MIWTSDSQLGKRFLKGALWALTGATISRGFVWLASIACARILGRAGFGKLAMINSTVNMFAALAGLGLGLAATKFVAELRESDKIRTARVIKLSQYIGVISGTSFAAILLAFATQISRGAIAAADLSDSLKLASGLLLFGAINGTQVGSLAGFESFRTIARVGLWTGLVSFPSIVIGAKFFGINGAVLGTVLGSALGTLLNHIALRRVMRKSEIPLDAGNVWVEARRVVSFSVPAYLSAIVVGPANWICFAILANRPGGYGEMGIFNAANQWRLLIEFVPMNLGTIGLPMLTNLYSLGAFRKRTEVIALNTRVAVAALGLAVLASLIFRKVILGAYGASFRQGGTILIILVLSSVPSIANNIIGQILVSEGRIWLRLLLDILLAIMMISLSALLVPRYLAGGLALAYFMSFLLLALIMVAWSVKVWAKKNNEIGRPNEKSRLRSLDII